MLERDLSNRIYGIKGWACLIVAANHFNNLYPPMKTNVITNFFSNGTYMVYIFLGISFYLAGTKYFKSEGFDFKTEFIKKYVSLSTSILIIYLIVFFIQKLNVFSLYTSVMSITGGGDAAIDYRSLHTLKEIFITAFARVLFVQSSALVFPLWMIHFAFIGYLITLLTAVLIGEGTMKRALLLCVLTAFILYKCFSHEYILCPLAVFVSYLYSHKAKINKLLALLALIFGVFTSILILPAAIRHLQGYIFILGAISFLMGAVFFQYKIVILENAVSVFLGKISFPIYIIHQSLTTSWCAFVFNRIFDWKRNVKIATNITLLSYFLVLIILAFLWSNYVDKAIGKISRHITHYLR